MTDLVSVLIGLILIILVLKFIKGVLKLVITFVVIGLITWYITSQGIDIKHELEKLAGIQTSNVSSLVKDHKTDWDQLYSNVANGVSNEQANS